MRWWPKQAREPDPAAGEFEAAKEQLDTALARLQVAIERIEHREAARERQRRAQPGHA